MSDQTKNRLKLKKRYVILPLITLLLVGVTLYFIGFLQLPFLSQLITSRSSRAVGTLGDNPALAAKTISNQINSLGKPQTQAEKASLASLYIQEASYVSDTENYTEAYKLVDKATALAPDNWRNFQSGAAIYLAGGDKNMALKLIHKSIDILKNSEEYSTYHSELEGQADRIEIGVAE